jgi:hypothetical protein
VPEKRLKLLILKVHPRNSSNLSSKFGWNLLGQDLVSHFSKEDCIFVEILPILNLNEPVNSTTSAKTPFENFIIRWKASGASERANYQLFLTELCELLGVEKPKPASANVKEAAYTFERPVLFDDGEGKTTTNFIDLYKQHCFVLEAKQGSDKATITEAELLGAARAKTKTGTAKRDTRNWEREMKKAKEQALRYARSLPAEEGWPPFLVVVDAGYCIDLYADFARQGKIYVPFPDPQSYRILLADLHREEIQQRLQQLFTNPLELDRVKGPQGSLVNWQSDWQNLPRYSKLQAMHRKR